MKDARRTRRSTREILTQPDAGAPTRERRTRRSTREILTQTVADAIADSAQRDHEFIHELNAKLEHRGYTVQVYIPNRNERRETPAGTFFREDG